VLTDLGPGRGTRFVVSREEGEREMNARRLVVQAMAGAVLLSTGRGARLLAAGEQAVVEQEPPAVRQAPEPAGGPPPQVSVAVAPHGLPRMELAGEGYLPEAVVETVRRTFPNARVTGIGRERENGVMYYEFNLVVEGRRIEVEVDEFGMIGEVERRAAGSEIPPALRRQLQGWAARGARVRVERHERWGTAEGGRFRPLESPRVFFEVEIRSGSQEREIIVPVESPRLPAPVARAVEVAFPKALVTSLDERTEYGVDLYDVHVISWARDAQVEVAGDGTLIATWTDVALNTMPRAVRQAAVQAAQKGRAVDADRGTLYAVFQDGKLVVLDQPVTVYEVGYRRADQQRDVVFNADGTVRDDGQWRQRGADEDEDDEDEDD
jgi:hypothetical protein